MKETRLFKSTLDLLFRAEPGDTKPLEENPVRLAGHASVFNQKGDGFLFTEEIAPGAFEKTLASDSTKFALWNHDYNFPLASTKAGTLDLREDDTGLYTEIEPSDTSFARDLVANVRAGVIDKMSFGFRIIDEDVDTRPERPHFIVKEVELIEVSPVTLPFYDGTDIGIAAARAGAGVFAIYGEAQEMPKHFNPYTPQSIEKLSQRIKRAGGDLREAREQLTHFYLHRKRTIELSRKTIT
ncbi:MAG: HK97 family phage prohead protease [Candidatus Latescibacteria bacterium]|nr:HK97 family phage prohead protease [Candidatus Latescibacterota bacterium]NIO78051.1 HK97 family phage prohead protease [Candidatus Latescibacterota bacterium]